MKRRAFLMAAGAAAVFPWRNPVQPSLGMPASVKDVVESLGVRLRQARVALTPGRSIPRRQALKGCGVGAGAASFHPD